VALRRGARAVDRGGLENRCTLTGYRGFESHPLRQPVWVRERTHLGVAERRPKRAKSGGQRDFLLSHPRPSARRPQAQKAAELCFKPRGRPAPCRCIRANTDRRRIGRGSQSFVRGNRQSLVAAETAREIGWWLLKPSTRAPCFRRPWPIPLVVGAISR
jgi:hypothetical protein